MTIKTTKIAYKLWIDQIEDKVKYYKLVEKLKSQGLKVFDTHSEKYTFKTENIELETSSLFDNQWNSTEDRVFDWYEGIYPNKSLKAGYYLKQNNDMHIVRATSYKCGFCGHIHSINIGYCDKCLGSEYLEVEQLKLLKLIAISDKREYDCDLSSTIKDKLLIKYYAAQDKTNALKAREQRVDIAKTYEKTLKNAIVDRDYKNWLLDNNISLNNVIYYNHTDEICFGWRKSLTDEEQKALTKKLVNFPFNHYFKRG